MQRGKPTTQAAHFAFVAPDRDAVDTFHAAGLVAGGSDNGAPGPRPHYHAAYYGAFVLDPDGHNIEAVCHEAPETNPYPHQRFSSVVVLSTETVAKFALAAGDTNPIHHDPAFAQSTRYGRLI